MILYFFITIMMVMKRIVIVMSVNIPHFDQAQEGGDNDQLKSSSSYLVST